ncbi:shikimate O-hydroxycinnamoyltransferase-like [Coffea eugenioides]|uniref:shikimate O-hydroxycinnamoyltransferase-like n=1 Tax=Coffea eugenioides TaxID=49369 RepID=UPI000F6084AC|nr:shikimate O-hydroxycinnamoyltransferase-like [Coffea eugenioides]XP_027151004.1 shikimate O-hydroxycinnamoyltransferase-like [Coffea eugenioides]
MGVIKGEFEVTIRKNEVVPPAMPMQEYRLPQSNLDLLLPPVNPSSIFFYKKPLDEKFTFDCMVGILKTALAQTLVHYYPLAGEMVQNEAGEPEVLCNNRGVDFIEAFADVQLKDLNFHNPDESIGGKLVPAWTRGMMAVQVTGLKCGGLVVAYTVDHRLTDAYSSQMLVLSWIEHAQAKPLSRIPSFQRSLLLPRHPGHYDSSIEKVYLPISKLQLEANYHDDQGDISRVYYVEAKQISELQSLANNPKNTGIGGKRTKLESFSAYLWKILASSVDKSHEKICRIGIIVDGRSRLANGDETKAELMEAYYGNVLSIPFGEKKIEELKKKPLSWIADEVHDFINGATNKEHFLGVIDWVEAHRPEPALARMYATRVTEEGPAVVISSGLRFPVTEMDFAWGVPAILSYYFPWGAQAGYVVPMPSPIGNGDWIVYIHMLKDQLHFIESEAPHIFKPLTSTYLNLM